MENSLMQIFSIVSFGLWFHSLSLAILKYSGILNLKQAILLFTFWAIPSVPCHIFFHRWNCVLNLMWPLVQASLHWFSKGLIPICLFFCYFHRHKHLKPGTQLWVHIWQNFSDTSAYHWWLPCLFLKMHYAFCRDFHQKLCFWIWFFCDLFHVLFEWCLYFYFYRI